MRSLRSTYKMLLLFATFAALFVGCAAAPIGITKVVHLDLRCNPQCNNGHGVRLDMLQTIAPVGSSTPLNEIDFLQHRTVYLVPGATLSVKLKIHQNATNLTVIGDFASEGEGTPQRLAYSVSFLQTLRKKTIECTQAGFSEI